jgi:hypothetical protein
MWFLVRLEKGYEQFIEGTYICLWGEEAGRRLFRNDHCIYYHLGSAWAMQLSILQRFDLYTTFS